MRATWCGEGFLRPDIGIQGEVTVGGIDSNGGISSEETVEVREGSGTGDVLSIDEGIAKEVDCSCLWTGHHHSGVDGVSFVVGGLVGFPVEAVDSCAGRVCLGGMGSSKESEDGEKTDCEEGREVCEYGKRLWFHSGGVGVGWRVVTMRGGDSWMLREYVGSIA